MNNKSKKKKKKPRVRVVSKGALCLLQLWDYCLAKQRGGKCTYPKHCPLKEGGVLLIEKKEDKT